MAQHGHDPPPGRLGSDEKPGREPRKRAKTCFGLQIGRLEEEVLGGWEGALCLEDPPQEDGDRGVPRGGGQGATTTIQWVGEQQHSKEKSASRPRRTLGWCGRWDNALQGHNRAH